MQTTWKPHTEHGDLTTRSNLPDSVYAFPKQKKEPLTDASQRRKLLRQLLVVGIIRAHQRRFARIVTRYVFSAFRLISDTNWRF